jgi:hypothetical protein
VAFDPPLHWLVKVGFSGWSLKNRGGQVSIHRNKSKRGDFAFVLGTAAVAFLTAGSPLKFQRSMDLKVLTTLW